MVTDLGGIHARNGSNQATVGVIVKRNSRSPRFEALPYKVMIEQGQAPDVPIISVFAQASDEKVRGTLL